MAVSKETFQSYMRDPTEHFDSPEEVETHAELSLEQKLEILESWKLDEEELQVATEENMQGGNADCLPQVVSALTRVRRLLP